MLDSQWKPLIEHAWVWRYQPQPTASAEMEWGCQWNRGRYAARFLPDPVPLGNRDPARHRMRQR